MLNLMDLHTLSTDKNAMLAKLQSWGLVPQPGSYPCNRCSSPLTLQKSSRDKDGFIWSCNGYVLDSKRKRVRYSGTASFRKSTFFDRSPLSTLQILGFAHLWTEDCPLVFIQKQVRIGSEAAVSWSSYCRKVLLEHFFEMKGQVGGDEVVVEIHESKFGKRKYYRGHTLEGQSVFGLYERGTGRGFLVAVEDKGPLTLIPLIQEWILSGTTIVSNFWKAHDCLETDGYHRLKDNRSITFKDPSPGTQQKTYNLGNLVKYLFFKKCGELHLDRTVEFLRTAGQQYNPLVSRAASEEAEDPDSSEDDDVPVDFK